MKKVNCSLPGFQTCSERSFSTCSPTLNAFDQYGSTHDVDILQHYTASGISYNKTRPASTKGQKSSDELLLSPCRRRAKRFKKNESKSTWHSIDTFQKQRNKPENLYNIPTWRKLDLPHSTPSIKTNTSSTHPLKLLHAAALRRHQKQQTKHSPVTSHFLTFPIWYRNFLCVPTSLAPFRTTHLTFSLQWRYTVHLRPYYVSSSCPLFNLNCAQQRYDSVQSISFTEMQTAMKDTCSVPVDLYCSRLDTSKQFHPEKDCQLSAAVFSRDSLCHSLFVLRSDCRPLIQSYGPTLSASRLDRSPAVKSLVCVKV